MLIKNERWDQQLMGYESFYLCSRYFTLSSGRLDI
jgi:hypothetical protein